MKTAEPSQCSGIKPSFADIRSMWHFPLNKGFINIAPFQRGQKAN